MRIVGRPAGFPHATTATPVAVPDPARAPAPATRPAARFDGVTTTARTPEAARPAVDPARTAGHAAAVSAMASGRVFDLSPPGVAPAAQEFLQSIRPRLDAFRAGTAGASVRNLVVNGRTAEQLHASLLAAGFEHRREPLRGPTIPRPAGALPDGTPLYALKGGGTTADPAHAGVEMVPSFVRRDGARVLDATDNVVPHDIYVHPQDGGMVRIKPEGDPSSALRPEPHVSKAMLLAGSGPGGRFSVERDTGWPNEAFKVTGEGHAVPKAPRPEFGLRPMGATHGQLARFAPAQVGPQPGESAYQDAIMAAAHTNLPPRTAGG